VAYERAKGGRTLDTTTVVEQVLAHYGVRGMRWGVRKSELAAGPQPPKKGAELVLQRDFKTGDKLTIYKMPPSAVAKTLSRISKNYAKEVKNYPQFNFYDKNGSRVGEGAFVRKKDELYLDWITVKTKHRGKGYASAAMKGVVKYAQREGIKKMTLEVPGNAPDAQHIYTKMGFKLNGKNEPPDGPNDPWGGLKGMEYRVPQGRVKHAELTAEEQWEEAFAEEFADILSEQFGTSGGSMEQSDDLINFLAHYGIKGMRWGQRKKQARPVSSDAKAKTEVKERVKKDKISAISNADLQATIRRMQLEQDFKRLSVNEKPQLQRMVSSFLLEAGKREVQAYAAKKLTVAAIKKVATGGLA
jgi:predicted GNAT family acetyltransferase